MTLPTRSLATVSKFATLSLTAVVCTLAAAPAHADFSTFFGENLNNSSTIPLTTYAAATNAQNAFLSNLSGVGTETFESFTPGTAPPITLNFQGAGTATLNGGGPVLSQAPGTANGFGRYAISGSNYYQANAANFSVTFSQAIAAFGFFGVDIGDFGGSLSLQLFRAGALVTTLNVGNTVGSGASTDGSVLYYGLIARTTAEQFDEVRFNNNNFADVFAFDNLTIGSGQQVTPVPGPGPLAGLLALGALGGFGRFRKRKAKQSAAQ